MTKNEKAMLLLHKDNKHYVRSRWMFYSWYTQSRVRVAFDGTTVIRLYFKKLPVVRGEDYLMEDFFEDFLSPTDVELYIFKNTFKIEWELHTMIKERYAYKE